jgi:hypothetical protein
VGRGVPNIPGFGDRCKEARMKGPGVVKAEGFRFGDGSGNFHFKGHMIGGGAGQRGEVGIRQDSIPSQANEGTIEPFKSGDVTFVGPGKVPIKEGQFNQAKVMNHIIKSFSFGAMKVGIIFLGGISNHVKIAADQPRRVSRRSKVLELSKKRRAQVWGGRSINIRDDKLLVSVHVLQRS